MVLLLLVQHVLLLRLLQRPLVHVPSVHLLQLLALLQGIPHAPLGTLLCWHGLLPQKKEVETPPQSSQTAAEQ